MTTLELDKCRSQLNKMKKAESGFYSELNKILLVIDDKVLFCDYGMSSKIGKRIKDFKLMIIRKKIDKITNDVKVLNNTLNNEYMINLINKIHSTADIMHFSAAMSFSNLEDVDLFMNEKEADIILFRESLMNLTTGYEINTLKLNKYNFLIKDIL